MKCLSVVHSSGRAFASRASALLRSISGDLSRGDHPSVTDPAGIVSASPATGQRYGLSPLRYGVQQYSSGVL